MAEEIFGFIGCGNMGSALARAVGRAIPGQRLLLSNRSPEKARALAEDLGAAVGSNAQLAAESDYLFLGVKPQMMAELLAELRPALLRREQPCTLVTMAAGISIAQLRDMAGGAYPVIRIMPNTPCAIGQGMLLCTADGLSPDRLASFSAALAAAGRLDWLEETLMDAGSAVSGCGPAFVYLFAEALADGGVACGLPRRRARTYAAQTLLGAAALLLETGDTPGSLKDAVCSPGGTTIQGVRVLEQAGFRSAAVEAVIAAYEKTKELGAKK